MATDDKPRVCDYETMDYRRDFWGSGNREYEDAVERIALAKLLPQRGQWCVELGAGFGRLADLYRERYERVVLVDYCRPLLQQARERLGSPPGLFLVVGDVYNLPFADAVFDVATMVRVLHHIEDPPACLAEVHRVMRSRGSYVLEYANKRNVKEVARFLLGRSKRDTHSRDPSMLDDLYFNYHPAYVKARLRETGFRVRAERSVSLFRTPILKRHIGARPLVALDARLQGPLGRFQVSPSIFVSCEVEKAPSPALTVDEPPWRCPQCHATELMKMPELLVCPRCRAEWSVADGIYDFKAPVGATGAARPC